MSIEASAPLDKPVLLGFACDEGVRRNNGRIGAAGGPAAIRSALANIRRWDGAAIPDVGTVSCEDGDLEGAQDRLAGEVLAQLEQDRQPIVIGGGHEVAWGSYQGLRRHLGPSAGRLGIINFDAHFDLREPEAGGNSGTPFRQIAEWCEANDEDFHYLVLGINPAMNSQALFDYAALKGVQWVADSAVTQYNEKLDTLVADFVAPLDYLYLTICLDAFPATIAPGVSAPGVPGICEKTGLGLLRSILKQCQKADTQLLLVDIAEMNPVYDLYGITARWAGRLIYEMLETA